jgi:hypothetical protein
MNRRDFVNTSGMALLAATLAELSPELALPMAEAHESTRESSVARSTFQLGRKNNPEVVRGAYEFSAMGLGASAPPYVYAFYDEDAKKFISPLEVKPTLKKGSYTMQPTLHSFNIRKADQANFKNLKNQVQLGFNATAPITKSDQLTWVFMNAVDIFLAKDQSGRQDQLTKFTNSNGKSATPLDATPKINVLNGTVSLQVTAFGQKQEGFWKKFFDILTKAVNSPIVSTASKGFGIPGLAPCRYPNCMSLELSSVS